jgi:hypothetical protein
MIRFLKRAVSFEKAGSVLFDVIVKEALGCHGFVVAVRYLVIIRHAHFM